MAARATLVAALAIPAGAVEPGPAEDRMTLEARVHPAVAALTPQATLLCVTNVNRRSGSGQRLFDVKAENRVVLDNYDVFREAGGKNVAHDESFEVTVTDGRLDLEFISVRDNAKIGGIEIDYLA